MKEAINSPEVAFQIIAFHLLLENYHFLIIRHAMFVVFRRILLAQLFSWATVTEVKEGFQHVDLFIG